MARPRKSDQTREDLLTIGTEMLTSQGYHGTGIKQVLDAVGVPKGSFYNFFPSKEAFVAAAIYRYGEQVEREFERGLAVWNAKLGWCNSGAAFETKYNTRSMRGEAAPACWAPCLPVSHRTVPFVSRL